MKKFLIITTLVLFSCSYAFAQMEITIDNECVYLDELTASQQKELEAKIVENLTELR